MSQSRTETLILLLMAIVILLMVALGGLFFRMIELQREVWLSLLLGLCDPRVKYLVFHIKTYMSFLLLEVVAPLQAATASFVTDRWEGNGYSRDDTQDQTGVQPVADHGYAGIVIGCLR